MTNNQTPINRTPPEEVAGMEYYNSHTEYGEQVYVPNPDGPGELVLAWGELTPYEKQWYMDAAAQEL